MKTNSSDVLDVIVSKKLKLIREDRKFQNLSHFQNYLFLVVGLKKVNILSSFQRSGEIIQLNPDLNKGIYLVKISDSISAKSKKLIIE